MTVLETVAASTLPHRDAETLLLHACGRDRAWLLAHPEADVEPAQAAAFAALAARRAAGEPLQYILGYTEFYGLRLRVTPAVLIPRPETELLVEQVLLWATQFRDERTLRIADVGTGSGAIAITLATHLAGADITATDIAADALTIARANAVEHNCEARIRFAQTSLLEGVTEQRFDAIVSNPPYIPAGDAATMQHEVVAHEPHTALFAGADGLDVYRELIPAAHAALQPGGLLALEFGYGQREALTALLAAWNDVRFIDDYAGIPRIVLAMKM
jgi:release factor glutamine methyltransferase